MERSVNCDTIWSPRRVPTIASPPSRGGSAAATRPRKTHNESRKRIGNASSSARATSGSELMPAACSSVLRAATLSDAGSSKLSAPAFIEPATGPPITPATTANNSVASRTRLGRALTRRAIEVSIPSRLPAQRAAGPGGSLAARDLGQVDGGGDIEQHARREERAHLFGGRARQTLDRAVELTPPAPYDGADLV